MVEVSEEEQSQRISRPGCDSDEKIPEPDPTFKRTPALLHQIALLKHDKNSDYLVSNELFLISAFMTNIPVS